jgi:5'-deoxynucleotidase YfbR-like HD superfamily hydrolase
MELLNTDKNADTGFKLILLSGHVIDLQNLEESMKNVTVKDIAISLAREGRFYNQTRKGVYSVAQHTCLATTLYLAECQQKGKILDFYENGLEVLHHDDHEFIMKDVPFQIKNWIGGEYSKKSDELQSHINSKFGLKNDENTNRLVKRMDLWALAHELTMFTYDFRVRDYLPQKIQLPPEYSECWDEKKSVDVYLELHYRLTNERNKAKISV